MSDPSPLPASSQPMGDAAPIGARTPPPAPGPESSPTGGPGWKSWVAAGAVAAVIAIGAVVMVGGGDSSTPDPGDPATVDAGSGSQPQGPGGGARPGFGGGTRGTVEAVDSDTISLRIDSDELVEVAATDETQVVEITEGTLEDLAVGDNIVATGEAGDDGVVAAESIANSGDQEAAVSGPGGGFTPPEGMERPEGGGPPEGMEWPEGRERPGGPGAGGPGNFTRPTSGTITAIDGPTVTVETADGEAVTVEVGEDTTITVSSIIDAADISEGDTLIAVGETADGVLAATSIRVGDAGLLDSGFGGRPGGPSGPAQSGEDTTTTTTA